MRVLLLTVLLVWTATADAAAPTATVPADKGFASGLVAGGIATFKSIPYAAPPVGALHALLDPCS